MLDFKTILYDSQCSLTCIKKEGPKYTAFSGLTFCKNSSFKPKNLQEAFTLKEPKRQLGYQKFSVSFLSLALKINPIVFDLKK